MPQGFGCWWNAERHCIDILIWKLTQEGIQTLLEHSKICWSVCVLCVCVHSYSRVRTVSEVSCNGSCIEYSGFSNDYITKSKSEARPGLNHVKVRIMIYCSSQEDCNRHQEFAILLKIIRKFPRSVETSK